MKNISPDTFKNPTYKWNRILLIKPNYRSPGWDYYNMNFPPINLTSIASYLTDLQVEVEILDAKVKNLNDNQIRKKIEAFHPDLVGISVFVSAAINTCNNISKIIKDINPNCVIVYGGRHPTFEPDETLSVNEVDILVRREGELTFRELIIKGTPENVKGISYKSNGTLIHNPERQLMNKKEYENIRIPARFLTKNNKYQMLTVRLETVETSRGCPYTCKFCTTHIINNKLWRPRPVERILTELKMISHNKKITDIFFVDDNLTVNTKRIEYLCRRIIECKKSKEINDFKFFAQVRVDSVVKSPQMIQMMAKAGFWVVFIGIESVNEKTLKDIRKGLSFSQVLKALKILHENKIIVIGNLIIGVDLNATENDIKKEIKFIKSIDIDLISYVLLTPFPGSDTLKELEEKGLVMTKNWSKYTVMDAVIKTNVLSPKELQALLYYSFKELKYINNYKGLVYRIYKTRGIMYILNIKRIISLLDSYLKIRKLFKKKS